MNTNCGCACCNLQPLVYDILLGARKRCSECVLAANSKHWFTISVLVPESDARRECLLQTPSTGLPHPSWCRKAMLGVSACCKLQALVYDIRLGAGKRCSESDLAANSKHWFTTSFLVPESDCSECVLAANSKHWFTTSVLVPESNARSVCLLLGHHRFSSHMISQHCHKRL